MKLSTYSKKGLALSVSKGFTLIELLVVIAIIGILAAALIATIDPLEQIRKSQDTTMKNISVEYVNAMTRYYATHQTFPWDTVLNGGALCAGSTGESGPTAGVLISAYSAGITNCTATLIADNELKSAFAQAQNLNKITYSYDASTRSGRACFAPVSKSQITDANTRFTTAIGGTGTACPATTAGCYWCVQ